MLICFSGIDGSGKTRLCKALVSELESYGVPTRYVYGRFLPVVMAPFFKISQTLALRDKDLQTHYYARRETKKHLLRDPIIFRLFVFGVLFDQMLRTLLKIYLPSILAKQVIICDRYIIDTVIMDIALSCDLDDNKVMEILRLFLRMFPRAHLVFVVDVPPRVAYERKKEILTVEVLKELSQAYLCIGKKLGVTIIDGTKKPLELKRLVLSELKTTGITLSRQRRKRK